MSSQEPEQRLAALTLEEKVRLLTGETTWTTWPMPAVGLRPMVLSDGPAGVRGPRDVDPVPSASFPSPSAIAATWDTRLAEGLGELFAVEARRQGADVVLAPAINLHRTPYGGRHFENYSEDPLLTGAIAAAVVTGLQAHGIAATAKHLVANESETARTTYRARLDERTLREVYLPPFEAVVAAGVWLVMAAYNGLDDGTESAPATEHRRLLTGILRDELGFDGVVVSDWMAARSTVPTALAGLDLVMPGPAGPWGPALVEAVEAGHVPQRLVDAKVLRILRLAERVGALATGDVDPPPLDIDVPARLRALAAASAVVLRNRDDTLPLDVAAVRRVALIGPNAVDPHTQGEGSARTYPAHVVRPEEGLRAALGPEVEVVVEPGCHGRTRAPLAEAVGGVVRYLAADGAAVADDAVVGPKFRLVPPDGAVCARVELSIEVDGPGEHVLTIGVLGRHRTTADGVEVWSQQAQANEDDVLTGVDNDPPGAMLGIAADPRRTVEVVIDVDIPVLGDFGRWSAVVVRHRPPGRDEARLMTDAVAAAAVSDVAVVIVGTGEEHESEGVDRTTLALSGRQDELVRAVSAVAPRTVVVVNAGAPVLLPWLDDVDAVLWQWLPGQEGGHGLADALLGVVEPAGRLPWTLPATEGDVPVRDVVPDHGTLAYTEGVLVGYRAWDAAGGEPARPFGYGLGYSSWSIEQVDAPGSVGPGQDLPITVTVRNTGPRDGRHVVQAYLQTPRPTPADPPWQLAAFAVVDGRAGQSVSVSMTAPARAFQRWRDDGWATTPGRYSLRVASHSRDPGRTTTVVVGR